MADDIKVICDREDIVAFADFVRRRTNIAHKLTMDEIIAETANISGLKVATSTITINIARTLYARDIRVSYLTLTNEGLVEGSKEFPSTRSSITIDNVVQGSIFSVRGNLSAIGDSISSDYLRHCGGRQSIMESPGYFEHILQLLTGAPSQFTVNWEDTK